MDVGIARVSTWRSAQQKRRTGVVDQDVVDLVNDGKRQASLKRVVMRIGLAMRAEQAGAHAGLDERRALLAAIDRLTSPAQMGEVFKVALLVPAGSGQPPGFETERP